MGSVEVGKVADLVLLEANPFEDISNTKRISHVVSKGVVYGVEMLIEAGKGP